MIENFNLKHSKVLSTSGMRKGRKRLTKFQAADGGLDEYLVWGWLFILLAEYTGFCFGQAAAEWILERTLPIFSALMTQITIS